MWKSKRKLEKEKLKAQEEEYRIKRTFIDSTRKIYERIKKYCLKNKLTFEYEITDIYENTNFFILNCKEEHISDLYDIYNHWTEYYSSQDKEPYTLIIGKYNYIKTKKSTKNE